MSKFAIRLLSLAMYATSLPVISMMTSDQAETSSTKHTKKQHRNIQWSRGFSDPRSANAWIVTGPSSQAGPVCPATPEASIAGSFLLQLMKIPIENGPAVAGDAARGRKLGMTRPQEITFGEM